jgi:hypothetical protein
MMGLLERVLFPPAPPTRPAVLRIAIGGFCLWYLASRCRLVMRIARSDPALFQPIGVAAVLPRPLPVGVVRAALAATLLANVAFVLGWKHRVTGPLFSGLLLSVLTYRNSWSMIYHNDNALVLHALILGLTPSADALSLDARARRHRRRTERPGSVADPAVPEAAWRYGWPVALLNAATTTTYLVAGVSKVVGPLGWKWASGEGMRDQVAIDALRKDLLGEGASPLAFALHDKVTVYRLLGIGSLAIELGAPLALADRRLGRWWALAAFGMHWGILGVMGIKFRYQLCGLIFAPFLDVEAAARWLERAARKGVVR